MADRGSDGRFVTGNSIGSLPRPGSAHNKRNLQHGIYSEILYNGKLSSWQAEAVSAVSAKPREALEDMYRCLCIRETIALQELEKCTTHPDEMHLIQVKNVDGEHPYTETTAIPGIEYGKRFEHALDLIHGRKQEVVKALRAMDEADRKLQLEKKKLKISEMKLIGEVEVTDVDLPDPLLGDPEDEVGDD